MIKIILISIIIFIVTFLAILWIGSAPDSENIINTVDGRFTLIYISSIASILTGVALWANGVDENKKN